MMEDSRADQNAVSVSGGRFDVERQTRFGFESTFSYCRCDVSTKLVLFLNKARR